MTVSVALEKRMRREHVGPVDYDASSHVVTATAAVLHVEPRTRAQEQALFLLTHWGYGSAVAVVHEALLAREPERVAGPVFYLACQSMAFALFPTIGGTPPPWRWRRDLLVTSLGQHVVYAVGVAATSAVLRRRREARRQAEDDQPRTPATSSNVGRK
jgi:hypothetical protein